MGTRMIAIAELKKCGSWVLAHELSADPDYNDELAPQNIAPESWGKFNFAVYYERSGEKDFPEDMSLELQQFIDRHWQDANRPSWISLNDLKAFHTEDAEGRYAHFDLELFSALSNHCDEKIRVVFWADQ